MIARFHYDREIYRRFLNDELSTVEETDVKTHVENCDDCQSTLESISQDQVSWDAIPRLLTRDKGSQTEVGHDRSPADFLVPSDHPNSLGRFGRFEIMEYLGTGGMGVVLKGYDPALNRFSAIKVLAPVLATSASARKRFAREAKSAAAVVHEHVVPIQTVDEENGLPYFVMPVIDGRSLQQRVDEDGPLEVTEVLRIGMQIASGLAAAHSQGLVHRDVKPANVLLENGVERVMLTDFGLARAMDDANMTQSGVITGTPQYMSPEQAQGFEVGPPSDLFSLGSVLYFMCTGHSPFRAKSTFGVLNRIVGDKHRPVRSANSEVPEWLQHIIDRLLEKDPADRFETATEVAETLSSWLAHLQQPEVVAQPPVPTARKQPAGTGGPRRIGPGIAAAVGGFLLLLAGVLISIEMGKGTITIECSDDGVPVRIMKGDHVAKKLTIHRGATSTSISAGNYVVEIDGPTDGLEVKQGIFRLTRGGSAVAKIVEKVLSRPNAESIAEFDDLPNPSAGIVEIAKEKPSPVDEREEIPPMRVVTSTKAKDSAKREAKLQLGLAESEYRAAKAVAENVLRIRAAVVAHDLAKAEYEASIEANRLTPGVITAGELRRQASEVEQAAIKIELAEQDANQARNVALVKYKAFELAKHRLAKIDGSTATQVARTADTTVFTTADWCPTGKLMEQAIDKLIAEGHPITKVQASGKDETEIPSLAKFRNGERKAYHTGPMSEQEIIDFVESRSDNTSVVSEWVPCSFHLMNEQGQPAGNGFSVDLTAPPHLNDATKTDFQKARVHANRDGVVDLGLLRRQVYLATITSPWNEVTYVKVDTRLATSINKSVVCPTPLKVAPLTCQIDWPEDLKERRFSLCLGFTQDSEHNRKVGGNSWRNQDARHFELVITSDGNFVRNTNGELAVFQPAPLYTDDDGLLHLPFGGASSVSLDAQAKVWVGKYRLISLFVLPEIAAIRATNELPAKSVARVVFHTYDHPPANREHESTERRMDMPRTFPDFEIRANESNVWKLDLPSAFIDLLRRQDTADSDR